MQENLDFKPKLFEDRIDAARKLLDVLPISTMQEENWTLIAISSGAIEMTEYICQKLNLFYDILFTEAITAPSNPECSIAMVSETEELVVHNQLIESFDINIEYVYGEAHRKYEEKILKYVYKYRKGEPINSLVDKNILLIDEGCETGLTAFIAIKTSMKSKANSVKLATPMIPQNIEGELESVTDELYTLSHIVNFIETDFYYEDKKPMLSEEIIEILENSKHYLPLQKKQTQKTKIGEKDE